MKRGLSPIFFVTLLAFLSGASIAQVTVFTGSDAINPHTWNAPDNWSNGIVPLAGERILISGDSVSITSVDPTLHYIDLKNGAVLFNQRKISISTDTFGIRVEESTLRNEGTILTEAIGPVNQPNSAAILLDLKSQLFNDNEIEISTKIYGLYILAGSGVVNEGSIDVKMTDGGLPIYVNGMNSNFDNFSELSTQDFGGTVYVLNDAHSINHDSGRIDATATAGLQISANAVFVNFGVIVMDIGTDSSSLAIFVDDADLEPPSGSITISRHDPSLNPSIWLVNNAELTTSSGAELFVSSTLSNADLFEISSSQFECAGIFEVTN